MSQQENCAGPVCENIFWGVSLFPTHRHGVRAEWDINPRFQDPLPHSYQLQVSFVGVEDEAGWSDVGLPAGNPPFLEDDTPRHFGKLNRTHYRIKVTTPVGIYFSRPASVLDTFPDSESRAYYKNLVDAWALSLSAAQAGQDGFLLKRKLYGPRCEFGCLDHVTGEVTVTLCENCYGTGFDGGYFDPVPCVYAELSQVASKDRLDQVRGTADKELRVRARMLARPQLFEQDIWVSRHNDTRWMVHGVQHLAELRGVPVAVSAELHLLPATHPIYLLNINA